MARRPVLTNPKGSPPPVAEGPKAQPVGTGVPVEPGRGEPVDRPLELPERGPATTNAAGYPLEYVSVDTWISRPDLGPGCRTFVVAGHAIPPGLEGYTRTPA
jgi:hypothetical protein